LSVVFAKIYNYTGKKTEQLKLKLNEN